MDFYGPTNIDKNKLEKPQGYGENFQNDFFHPIWYLREYGTLHDMNLEIFCDGGARGNPGAAAIGVVIKNENGKVLHELGKKIGETTNNVAEYTALIEALSWVSKNMVDKDKLRLRVFLDSQLLVRQLLGIYKVKDPKLRILFVKVREREGEIGGNIFYEHIPREQNKEADKFVNDALDNKLPRD